jgi:hypothetical protein
MDENVLVPSSLQHTFVLNNQSLVNLNCEKILIPCMWQATVKSYSVRVPMAAQNNTKIECGAHKTENNRLSGNKRAI